MVLEVRTKKWGNSVGVIIPSETVANLNIKPGEKISIEIFEKWNVLKELFGSLKSNKVAEEAIKEVRKGLESKWLN